MGFNKISLASLCADICSCMGVEPPRSAEVSGGALKALCGDRLCDRTVMYNPDAQAQWLVEKYPEIFERVISKSRVRLPMATVMPSVTPVCFATMYTGAYPEVHGIRRYEKPVLTCDTIFDAMLRAGKKCAISATEGCSVSKIFLGRDMDYFIMPAGADADEQAVENGLELIKSDKYDFVVIYNGMYDSVMHATYPESEDAMEWLNHHTRAYERIYDTARDIAVSKGHRTLIGYATDHGVHTGESGRGAHGLDIPEDINIEHFYDIVGE